jgi:hypothetical protein
MNEETARHVVDGLRERGLDAHLAEEGVYQLGVRVVLSDGREALWGADGTDTLAAEVMSDGDLVGFIPEIEGSEDFTIADIVDAISRADYSQPEGRELPVAPPPAPALPIEGGVFRRFLGGFRSRD